MKSSWIKLLALACVVYWVTGAGQFIHEKLEHAPDHTGAVVTVKQAANPLFSTFQKPVESEDDCPTCQMLHMMKAPSSTPPSLPDFSESLVITLVLLAWQVPVVSVPLYLPARGPPLA
jgi:hypothetical protein